MGQSPYACTQARIEQFRLKLYRPPPPPPPLFLPTTPNTHPFESDISAVALPSIYIEVYFVLIAIPLEEGYVPPP